MRRLGAATALARCAAELEKPGMREVAGEAALEALRVAVLGLRMADHDAPGTGTKEALADALKARCRKGVLLAPCRCVPWSPATAVPA